MLTKIRNMARSEEGFTLIELMVVILIIGILMAIAVPSFFAFRNRGFAANAKSIRQTAVKAMELYATDNNGSYVGGNAAAMATKEPSITYADNGAASNVAVLTGQAVDGYTITVTGLDSKVYTAIKAGGGAVAYNSP